MPIPNCFDSDKATHLQHLCTSISYGQILTPYPELAASTIDISRIFTNTLTNPRDFGSHLQTYIHGLRPLFGLVHESGTQKSHRPSKSLSPVYNRVVNILMATLKAAAVRNQDLLEKITQENEALVSVCRALKNELAEAQEALARCKSETLKSMEPKIQKILDDHKQSLHSQATSLQQELDSITAATDAKLAKLTSAHETTTESLERECKATLQRMKDAALASERKMKDDLSARLSKVPSEIEESRRAARERLQSDRSQWQEQRGRELREEFEQRHQVELQRLRDKQARIVHELEEKLRVEASNENADLKNRLMKDESMHRNAETAIKRAVDEVESDIQRIRRHRSELVQEQQRLREKMSGCRCEKLRSQLQEQRMKREEVARNVETQKQKLHEVENAREGGATGLAAEITKMEEALRMMRAEVDQARAESVTRRELREARVRELEAKHQKEMEVVGVKVRQTVEKKDQIIQQLMDRLQAFGNTDVF